VRALELHAGRGGTVLGAFAGDTLVGIAVVVPEVRPRIAQLAWLHVTNGFRGRGIGTRLCDQLDDLARGAGATEMVVSATPSENTVRFYRGRGFAPMAEPLPELYELEPEDIHLHKPL
jgi:GNAT superfamily N-acetyltransferase